jgi:hypothetical protein
MRQTVLLFALFAAIISSSVFANEFSHDGISIQFPNRSTEKKIAQFDDFTTYQIILGYGTGSPQEAIEVYIHIRDISRDRQAQARKKEKGSAYESETSLAVAIENVRGFPEFRLMENAHFLDVSGNKTTKATVSYAAHYAARRWISGVAHEAIYCVTQATRSIEFRVLSLSDAPRELFSSAIKAIEEARIDGP